MYASYLKVCSHLATHAHIMIRVLRSLSFFRFLPHVNSTGVRTVVFGLSPGDTTWRSGQVGQCFGDFRTTSLEGHAEL